MPRALLIVLFAAAGFVAAALAGYFLVLALSSNTHDRSLEAVMTAAFLCGPVGAVVAGVVAFFRTA